ncbi:MAG TPA: type II toxin-antitoxin system RelE/ParE family toxin [Stellaceae bacterium]
MAGAVLNARFYRTAAGNEPVRDWLKGLSRDDRRTIGHDIGLVEDGWPVGMPVCRSLGGGLWEVRSDISDGRIARVIFLIRASHMVLLHGFIKKSQKTPEAELKTAARRLADFTARLKHGTGKSKG